MWNLRNKTNEQIIKETNKKTRLLNIENKVVVLPEGRWTGGMGEIGEGD